tara:strand:- start:45 stop:338 length:294 start_codon:yes stop_codon:yes gene_type:complete
MKKFLLIILVLSFLSGCVQNFAVLGPAISVVTTGNIHQAAISQGVNYGVKKTTGKNLNEHATSSFKDELRKCGTKHSARLNKIFFKTLDEIDCEISQ